MVSFKKRDGDEYFEAIEIFNKHICKKEYGAQFLALCPLCAAKYNEFIKKESTATEKLLKTLLDSTGLEIPVQLGNESKFLRFVETHYIDLQIALSEGLPEKG